MRNLRWALKWKLVWMAGLHELKILNSSSLVTSKEASSVKLTSIWANMELVLRRHTDSNLLNVSMKAHLSKSASKELKSVGHPPEIQPILNHPCMEMKRQLSLALWCSCRRIWISFKKRFNRVVKTMPNKLRYSMIRTIICRPNSRTQDSKLKSQLTRWRSSPSRNQRRRQIASSSRKLFKRKIKMSTARKLLSSKNKIRSKIWKPIIKPNKS